MPGRVLVFDPIFTNRIMLKSQLSIDFFDVSLATDFADLQTTVRRNTPDLILISYHADRAMDFEAVCWLKTNQTFAHIPVVFLQNSDDGSLWDQTHDLLVDDVLHYRASKWLMSARLSVLIRGKEQLDAISAQRRTILDMGFAEQNLGFPPAPTKPISIDISAAISTFDAVFTDQLADILAKDFPNLTLFTDTTAPSADIVVIDPENGGSAMAFAQMIKLRRTPDALRTKMLFIAPSNQDETAQRALEFGAADFASPTATPHELAIRLRRILWQQAVAHQAEKAVSNHLQSALIDPLTTLYNRRYAMQHLNRLITHAGQGKATLTAMILDLDRFKSINDTYGHLAGDAVIRQTSQRLKQNLRAADLVARLGGEEFLIILENASETRVRTIAERLRNEISSKSFLIDNGQAIPVSASIGVSETKSTWPTSAALIDNADTALYRAKGAGRNCVTYSDKAA